MSDDQSAIDFEQLGIGAVLKRYRLAVPPNQRDYAWEDEQVRTLFEDLALAISDDEKNYFLGTIVAVPVTHGTLEVVDGQQRLATTMLALAAMKFHVEQSIPNLSRALEDFISNVDSQTLENSPKMRMNAADNTVFESLLNTGTTGLGYIGSRVSHQNLQEAFVISKQKWIEIGKPIAASDRVSVYKKWMNYVEFNAKVILLKVPTSVNAFKMFETLNDRGLKTSQADLVKNYILGQSGDDLRNAQQVWGHIKGSLEAVDEEDITVNFLRQALICQNGYLKEANVYERVQSSVKGRSSSVKFLTELEVMARDYAALFNVSAEKWGQYPLRARKSLEVLDLFDIKPMRPLMLAISRKLSPVEASLALEGLVSIGVRLLIASSTRSGSVEQPLARMAHQVYTEKVSSAKDIFLGLASIIPSDEQFKTAFETATVSNPKFARYYLRTLESAHRKEAEPWFLPNEDPHSITLEHVLPLNPGADWPSFSDDAVKIFAKRIGNLVLLQARSNSNLRSDRFELKAPILKKAPYSTTSMIGDLTSWTPEQIAARQRTLAQIALTAWPDPSR